MEETQTEGDVCYHFYHAFCFVCKMFYFTQFSPDLICIFKLHFIQPKMILI